MNARLKYIVISVVLIAIAASNAFSATWEQLPAIVGVNKVDPKTVKADFDLLHPWKQDLPLPKAFEDAGLTRPVALVSASLYLDGGSRSYVFQGANGKFLVFCTDTKFYAGKDGKSENVTAPRIFLGTFHFTQKPRTVVPADSDTERFLIAALAAEARRKSPEQKK